MADIVNLNDRRKRKAREEVKPNAAAKRMMFGRTKGEKQRDEIRKVRRHPQARRRQARASDDDKR